MLHQIFVDDYHTKCSNFVEQKRECLFRLMRYVGLGENLSETVVVNADLLQECSVSPTHADDVVTDWKLRIHVG